jgi:signal transduction histidine kinase
MSRVIGCVFGQHDLWLVGLAGLLCLFSCATAMSMVRRAEDANSRQGDFWLAGAGLVGGIGIWGTHFIAMLAFRSGFPVAYDIGLTFFSVIIAISLCGLGFWIASARSHPLIGGGLAGAAIGVMHYVGMAAVRAPADMFWDAQYVAASIVLGVVPMAFGMSYVLRHGTLRAYAAGTGIFTLAICTMHFTGMSAVTWHYDPAVMVSDAVVDPSILAIAIAALAILVVALGLVGTIVDGHLKARMRGEAERLRAHIAELEATQAQLEETSHNLRGALEAADAANRAKSSFLAAMSHELRTPLNAVIGFSEMMQLEAFGPLGNPRYQQYAGDIRNSGKHLLELINDVLDLSRIDAGEFKLDESDFAVATLIEQSLRFIAPQAERADLRLKANSAPDLPRIRADQRRLKQALINLLANAVKFTPAGGSITVSATRTSTGLAIAVKDTGIGIAAADIPRALEQFGQVDSRLARKYEGAGLGLPLAKRFMELHGGTLTLESTVDVGTTVTLILPAARLVEADSAAA